MSATGDYVTALIQLKAGELSLLRSHAGQGLDERLEAFDLFSGLWWPLRQRSPTAPRREVAWLVAKLYAAFPLPLEVGRRLGCEMGACQPAADPGRARFARRFDRMLTLPASQMEPSLRWALGVLSRKRRGVDWVALTDDLSFWESEDTRLAWAEQFIGIHKGR